jgi:hypothetical protein
MERLVVAVQEDSLPPLLVVVVLETYRLSHLLKETTAGLAPLLHLPQPLLVEVEVGVEQVRSGVMGCQTLALLLKVETAVQV